MSEVSQRAQRELLKALGGRITSTFRTKAENDRAGGAEKSWHLRQGGAIDFVPKAGMKGATKGDIATILRNADIPFSELLGPGDKGHSDHFHIGGLGVARQQKAQPRSTFDRVKSRRNTEPTIAELHNAYKSGKMPAQGRAQFEQDVKEGRIFLPQDQLIASTPKRNVVPVDILDAYYRGDMPDEGATQLEQDIKTGAVLLPNGRKLEKAPPRTLGEKIGIGARAVGQGVADLSSLGNPAAGLIRTALGVPTDNELVDKAADALGAPVPRNESEQLASSIIRGVTGAAIPVGGASLLLRGAKAVEGGILSSIAQSPIKQVLSGAGAGAGGFYGEKYGGQPGAIIGSLVGGVGTFAAASKGQSLGRRVLNRTDTAQEAKIAQEVAGQYPREVMIDDAGRLTDEAHEVAMRTGVEPETVQRAYTPVNDNISPQSAFNASRDDLAKPVPVVNPAQSEAASEGITLSRGQAEQNFSVQNAESNLRNTASAEGDQARVFFEKQQQDIDGAVARFKESFGDLGASKTERGQAVQSAIEDLRDNGEKGVRSLYKIAGETLGDDVALRTDDILDAADGLILETPMEQTAKDALERALAKYGLIGGKVKTSGRYSNIVTDDGRNIRILGPVEPLTLRNAEAFRQSLNAARDARGLMGRAVQALDDSVEEVLTQGVDSQRVDAFKDARRASSTQKRTFGSKDVIAKLISWKNGTGSKAGIIPERVFDQIFAGGPEGLTNIKKVKAILLSGGTPETKAAWKSIQAQSLADIFGKAVNVQSGHVSGARLNTAISNFGEPKLKVILSEPEFNRLMKLRRIIGTATVPMSGTTNPSGSAYKIMNMMASLTSRFIPGGEFVAGIGRAGVDKLKAAAQTKETLQGITSYQAVPVEEASARVTTFVEQAEAGAFIPAFIAASSQEENNDSDTHQ